MIARPAGLLFVATLCIGILWNLSHWDSNNWRTVASLTPGFRTSSAPALTRPLVAATCIHKDRADIREWIEFHLLQGFDALYIYDFERESTTREVLAYYEETHRVEYIKWPPRNETEVPYDSDIRGNLHEQLRDCRIALDDSQSIPSACISAAYTDGLQRARVDDAEWYINLDIDEFVYPSDNRAVLDVLQMEGGSFDIVQLQGGVFGTSGHQIRQPRGYTDLFSSLVIFNNTLRAPLEPVQSGHEWASMAEYQFARRSFVRPHRASRSELYTFTNPSSRRGADVLQLHATDSPIRLNQYRYRYTKAPPSMVRSSREHQIPLSHKIDAFLSLEEDTTLVTRFANQLRTNLQKRFLEHPPFHADDYEPELFAMHPRDQHIAVETPDVCLAILTCRRIGLLRETVSRAIRYMSEFEPDVSFEIVLFDNGSGSHVRRQIENDLPLDKITLSTFNQGITAGVNELYFGSCRAPYILTLEDDWFARVATWPHWAPLIKMALTVMRLDDKVLEVWFRDWDINGRDYLQNRTEWIDVPLHLIYPLSNDRSLDTSITSWPRPFQYRKHQPPTAPYRWGTYTNGASLKSRDRLQKVGPMHYFNGEEEYVDRVNVNDFSSAHICVRNNVDDRCPDEGDLRLLFEHGGTLGRSAGHNDKEGTF